MIEQLERRSNLERIEIFESIFIFLSDDIESIGPTRTLSCLLYFLPKITLLNVVELIRKTCVFYARWWEFTYFIVRLPRQSTITWLSRYCLDLFEKMGWFLKRANEREKERERSLSGEKEYVVWTPSLSFSLSISL